eukprot:CAMPEP_0175932810 /NCGR_PEP_ID=MMETSP0108-20121206/19588_1 /TAXON_ID=195067 ORGANISM="Goniomonas pacifica, Strain CCMP1869" /NCGR_SAMPLE_ID=MMETSP0108 /ASSEMBLY_ACC=CAM_ASM_000204 /LENGTH=41 /DNA_ID= /DNA_START= /DNA_END= /DNA_ORIENTATION=
MTCATSPCPLSVAKCSGVLSKLSLALRTAPPVMRTCATSPC